MGDLTGALRRLPPWSGPALTLVAIAFGHILWKTLFRESSLIPGAALAPTFLAVVLSTFLGGRKSGTISAALATVYVGGLVLIVPDAQNVARFALIGLTLYASVVLIGKLKALAEAALEAERQNAARERQDAAEAKRANDALRANNETLETFVYVITHDLKEPVRAIEHHLHSARPTASDPATQSAIESAIDTNRRLGVLLQRLLEYSRASLTTPIQRPLTLREILDDGVCRPIYEHTVRVRNARLEVSGDATSFLGDPTLLGQAIGNLILNAVKHNPREAPRVSLRVEPGRGSVDIVIEDDGAGFPEALIHRFHTLKLNKPATIGGGFGLVIAKRALERLGGTMTIANLAEGAEVRLRLPADPHFSEPLDALTLAVR